jgi:hypothetical protein
MLSMCSIVAGGLSTDDTTGELPAFGDVSCIVPAGEHEPTSITARWELEHAVNYQRAHDEDLRASSRRVQGRSFGAAPDVRRSLLDQLSSQGFLRNYPTISFPRMFKLSSRVGSMAGQELQLGNCKATVLCELGRGSYGMVSLLGDAHSVGTGTLLAVKAQTETGMLAWEYEVLERVRERIGALSYLRFPMAHSMVFFADGAIMGLTPALLEGSISAPTSSSSVNLIDLVNLYHDHEGLRGVPEVLALHYTAQMLHTIETLHWKGKVLVRLSKIQNIVGFLFRSLLVCSVAFTSFILIPWLHLCDDGSTATSSRITGSLSSSPGTILPPT